MIHKLQFETLAFCYLLPNYICKGKQKRTIKSNISVSYDAIVEVTYNM